MQVKVPKGATFTCQLWRWNSETATRFFNCWFSFSFFYSEGDEDEDDDEEEDEGEDEEEPGLDYLQKENLEVNTFLLVHESFTNTIFKGSFFQKGHICVSFQKYFDVCVKFNFLSK